MKIMIPFFLYSYIWKFFYRELTSCTHHEVEKAKQDSAPSKSEPQEANAGKGER